MTNIQIPLPMNYITKQLLLPNSGAQCCNFEFTQPCLSDNKIWYDVSNLKMSYADWFTNPSVGLLDLCSNRFANSKIDDRLCFKSLYSNPNYCSNENRLDMNYMLPKTVSPIAFNNSIQFQAGPYIR